ncbi:putative calcium-binding protein [Frankia sp. EI5c]|uniref:excalibur calcium-binding domain-containing protein n=1 Tax=Frankia sp. EI5c TaxID=683316 RepID=UPI0007C40545|nr:excalibur calcium-binding domain-containing protein [Frankia sp. EI5c]OAA25655.1 putative calcium-binding protein [Frankia sp. EI5c]
MRQRLVKVWQRPVRLGRDMSGWTHRHPRVSAAAGAACLLLLVAVALMPAPGPAAVRDAAGSPAVTPAGSPAGSRDVAASVALDPAGPSTLVPRPVEPVVPADRASGRMPAPVGTVATSAPPAPGSGTAPAPRSVASASAAARTSPGTAPTTRTDPPKPAGSTPAAASKFYRSCFEVRAAGAAPLYANEPGYRVGLDPDRDGVACGRAPAARCTAAPADIPVLTRFGCWLSSLGMA